jgi:hypothetical protein
MKSGFYILQRPEIKPKGTRSFRDLFNVKFFYSAAPETALAGPFKTRQRAINQFVVPRVVRFMTNT